MAIGGGSMIGNLSILLSMDTAAFEKGATHAKKLMAKTQRQFQQMGSKFQSVGKSMTLGITAPFVGLMATAIPAATKAREAMAQVEAGLASMGGASGKTAEELQKSAKALQSVSTFNKNDILDKVTANMLTFGNVSGENFDRAQQAVVDMATRLKMDLQPATIMIGKALNDPVKGLAAMGRAGIQFSEDQKKMIKSMVEAGDTAGAQTLMLQELERQFKGSAKAARDAAPGSDTTDAWREFQETIGEVALKVLPALTDVLTRVLNAFNNLSPATQKTIVYVAAFAAAVGPVLFVVGKLISAFGVMLPLIVKLAPAFAALRVAMLALFANPVILGAAAVIAGIYLAWRNWDKIKEIVRGVYEAVKNWFGDKLKRIFDGVKQSVETVTGYFKTMYDRVVGNSYVPDMIARIGEEMRRLDAVMVRPAKDATSKTAQAFRQLQADVQGIMNRLFPEIARGNTFIDELQKLRAHAAEAKVPVDQLTEAVRRLRNEYFGTSDQPSIMEEQIELVGKLDLAFANLGEQVATVGHDMARIFDNIVSTAIDNFSDAIADVVMGAKSLGQAFGQIAKQIIRDIIAMTIRMLVFRAISGMFGGASPINVTSSGGAGAFDVPKWNKGGSGRFGGFSGIDRNVLSLNGTPIARVSKGEQFTVTPANDRAANDVTIHQTYSFQGVAVTKQEFAQGLMFAKHDTIATLKDMNRRGAR